MQPATAWLTREWTPLSVTAQRQLTFALVVAVSGNSKWIFVDGKIVVSGGIAATAGEGA